jgi:hypothetical protein
MSGGLALTMSCMSAVAFTDLANPQALPPVNWLPLPGQRAHKRKPSLHGAHAD